MIPAAFAYHRPQSLADAIGLLAQGGEEARVIAGGHSLVPMMKLRLARPQQLVDLQDLDELRGIRVEGTMLVVGAMTTQHELIGSATVATECPILRETALAIADPQVRYCGTLGGNLANGDPGNDMPAVMLALDAVYRVMGPRGERDIPAREFYNGIYATALADGEILTAIRIPIPGPGHGWAYEKQKRKVGDYATAAAAVVLTMAGGRCTAAAIGLTNLADTPLLTRDAGAALLGTGVDEAVIAEAVRCARAIASPAPDLRGPVEFRVHVAGIMVRRAILRAKERAR
ncbi:MAG TPA: xanthine dehydrogenase family protein subunit M [Stellaceae bacterium]